ncbi:MULTISPECIES: hypothetical protein [unclassified Enterobacter]|jgi:hypothetical protein|uniref:hypothetical protein n=1 Tax=unclassified Enterobacter TaxID=2608935 RepID=UPI0015C8EBBF|nr:MULTISPECIES: hypothetical protein [unclassified Enterobacter]MBB3303954.1 hypothetical protein [Enterobacter sp. Sphag1F]NYI12941.1 hypothetical protein [Enterobacter sp. Sphag71]
MPSYIVYTKIESNIPGHELLYDLLIYRIDGKGEKHVLVSVFQKVFSSSHQTEKHEINDTEDAMSVIYMLEMNLYRKHGGKLVLVSQSPSRKMYTLGEMVSGQSFSNDKRENICYFEAKTQTRPANDSDDNNIKNVSITCMERSFIAKEYPINGPDDPFEKRKIETEILSRLNRRSYPNQGETSLCGPAAFFYCLQIDRPDVYKQAANELWLYGKTKINDLVISPSDGCRHPKGSFYSYGGERISGLDWITLASLRDSENLIMSYDEVDDQVAGITVWDKLTKWFEKAGYVKVFSNVGLLRSNVKDLAHLNEHARNGCKVVCLISAGMLSGFGPKETLSKNHWIVWDGTLKNDKGEDVTEFSNPSDNVELNLFSWGIVGQQIKINKDLDYVRKHIFGGVAFKPLK